MDPKLLQPPFRRRFPRRAINLSVGVLLSGKYAVFAGKEIGEGGLLFQGHCSANTGSQLVVNFFVSGRQFVTARGEVVYVREKENSFGVKFHDLPFESRRAIRDYMTDRL